MTMEKFYKHTDNGILLNIKVVPNSSKTMIMGVEAAGIIEEPFLKIKISSPANENKANEELIKFLSKELKKFPIVNPRIKKKINYSFIP